MCLSVWISAMLSIPHISQEDSPNQYNPIGQQPVLLQYLGNSIDYKCDPDKE